LRARSRTAAASVDGADDTARDLVLQLEAVVERAVKSVGPNVRAARGVYQLTSDTHAAPGLRTLPSSTYRTPSSRATCFT
jgi:hypothetical protein